MKDFFYLCSENCISWIFGLFFENAHEHELRTPNEGINQRYLKIRADMADKICFGHAVKAISSLGVCSPGA